MEGFCRGCLIKYDEPMELLQYTEKNRRLFVYSTGLQVKRNDAFTFQLCKDCFLNMKQACKFKKNCRTSDKRFRNYIALKDVGDPVDFCTFLKNSDDTLTFRLPMATGNSTPANQKCRDDDNESTCTSIHNFMTDLLQGEEMPDTEARIIKEVIEEEADVLDDSLDSHWLQDDMSIDTDFRLDFSFSQFSTPQTINDDRCYTPKQKEDQMTFDTVNTEKQTKILKDFTNAFKTDDNIEELSIFVGGVSENTASFDKLKELSPMGIDVIDGMEKPEIGTLKSKPKLKEVIGDLGIGEIEGMDTSDSKIDENDQNFKELSDFEIQNINIVHEMERNKNFGKDEIDGDGNMAVKSNKSLKEMISNLDIEGMGKSDSQDSKSNQILKELMGNFSRDVNDASCKPDSIPNTNQNLKELCYFSLESFSRADKAENKTFKNVKSLKELCDFSLDSFEDTAKLGINTFKYDEKPKEFCDFGVLTNSESVRNDRKIKEVCDFGIEDIDKSKSNLNMPLLSNLLERDNIDTPEFDVPKGEIGFIQPNNDASNNSINIEAFFKDKPEQDKLETPDFEIPKGVISSIQPNYDVSNNSINMEAFFNDRPGRDKIDTPDFEIPKDVIDSIQSNNDVSNSSVNIETLLKDSLERDRIVTPDFEIPKEVRSIQLSNDISNNSINIEAFFNDRPGGDKIDTPNFEIPKGVISSIQPNNVASNCNVNVEALLKGKLEKDRLDTPDFEILDDVIDSVQSNNDVSNSSANIEDLLKNKPERDRIDTPDFDIPKGIRSIQSNYDISNSSINIEAFLKDRLKREKLDTPDFGISKDAIGSIQSINDVSNSSINIEALLKDRPKRDKIDTPDFGISQDAISNIQSNNDVSTSSINIEALLKDRPKRDKIDTPDFDISKETIGSIQSINDVSNNSINIEALLKDKPCSIDKNLEEALKRTDNKEFSLEDILISPPAASAASTPTITNILFGENLNTTDTNTKIEQYLESCQDVQGDIEILEEFFQNDTKEFDLEDIKRVNEGCKPEDWSKPIPVHDFELANKENDSKNIEVEISIDGKDQAGINNDIPVKKSEKEPMIHISQDDENDKFNVKFLYCKLCKIRYDTSRAFSVHFAKAHNIKIVKPRKPNKKKNKQDVTRTLMEATINISDTSVNEKFDFENSYCKLCKIKYDTSRALSIHFAKTHHIKIEKPKRVKVNKNHEIVCNHCGVKSRDHSNFARHVKKCSQKGMVYKCDRCQIEFTTQAHLEKHKTCHTKMKRKKDTGKEFVCTICGAILHKQCNLVLHMRRHTKDYSAKCELCDKGFYRQSDLKAHMRSHTGDTEFACKFCPKLFTRRDVLLRHILIHLDERLFECDYCNKRFIKKYDLKKHIQNESCRPKQKCKVVKKIMDLEKPQKHEEERVEIKKDVIVEVIKDITVIYTKGSEASIKQQLPFLETERSN